MSLCSPLCWATPGARHFFITRGLIFITRMLRGVYAEIIENLEAFGTHSRSALSAPFLLFECVCVCVCVCACVRACVRACMHACVRASSFFFQVNLASGYNGLVSQVITVCK